jgi:hypothetical protein
VNKSIKKAVALVVMIAALFAIFAGIGYISDFEGKDTIRSNLSLSHQGVMAAFAWISTKQATMTFAQR